MKIFIILLVLFFALSKTFAQNYQISFAGTGASNTVDSVKVENLTECTSLKMSGSDILHLLSVTGISQSNNITDHSIHVFPIPMKGLCSFDFEATPGGITTFELIDKNGKIILKQQDFVQISVTTQEDGALPQTTTTIVCFGQPRLTIKQAHTVPVYDGAIKTSGDALSFLRKTVVQYVV